MIKILFFLFITNLGFAQADKNVEYDEALEIDGQDQIEMEVEEETIEAQDSTGPSRVEIKQELNEGLDAELEKVEKEGPSTLPEQDPVAPVEKEVVEEKIEEAPLEQEEVELPAVPPVEPSANKPFYGFLFDNSKKSLFKTEARWKGMMVGLGVISLFPKTYQDSGTGGEIGYDPQFVVQSALEFGNVGRWSFLPNVFFVNPEDSRDSLMKKYVYGFGIDFVHNTTPWFRPHIGINNFFFSVKGNKTGTENVQNGGNIEPFYLSDRVRTSILNTIDLTLEFIHKKFSVDFKTHVFSLFESEKRNYAYSLHLNYFFDWETKKSASSETTENFVESPGEEIKDEILP
ncbi:MAG: hypothetical protein H6621_02000 [Halobacteriovoraceae bacterium]|nr:hypothetical protein [Halobacteriovoraceae bacterium]MCB9093815.1 hypothetical protein [Halobacteriovoraceae bacterium]